jgi:hypothetical protein
VERFPHRQFMPRDSSNSRGGDGLAPGGAVKGQRKSEHLLR